MKDAIVEEVREMRRQIEEEFDHDVNKYLDHVYEAGLFTRTDVEYFPDRLLLLGGEY